MNSRGQAERSPRINQKNVSSRVSGDTIVPPLTRLPVASRIEYRGFRYRFTPGYSKVAASAAARIDCLAREEYETAALALRRSFVFLDVSGNDACDPRRRILYDDRISPSIIIFSHRAKAIAESRLKLML